MVLCKREIIVPAMDIGQTKMTPNRKSQIEQGKNEKEMKLRN